MIRFSGYILCMFLLLPLLGESQNKKMGKNKEETLLWSADRKLAWTDYKGDPDQDSDAAASTTTYLSISYTLSKKGFSYSIRSGFDPRHSWGLHRTPYILAHEQGHFDIAEIFARKLNKKMQEYVLNRRTVKQDIERIYEETVEEKEKMQQEYDEQTRHSINRRQQAEWLKKIAALLDETAAYADYNGNNKGQ